MYLSFDVFFCQQRFSFAEKFGLLFLKNVKGRTDLLKLKNYSEKGIRIFNEICNPYSIKYFYSNPKKHGRFLKCYAKILVFLCRKCYPLAYLLSFFRFNCFENACEAAETFKNIISTGNQKILCLPRSIFIATTSKKFKQSGAMFIGVFLPSSNMHAWVIEDGIIADRYDIDWILYTPVSMMI